MRMDPSTSAKKLSLAACAVAVAATVGTAQAQETTHIDSMQRYCTASWRNAGIDQQDWQDCTQEVMTLMLQRVSRNRLAQAMRNEQSPERRELNRSIWCAVQRWRRRPKHVSLDSCDSAERTAQAPARETAESLDSVMTVADQCLTSRQQAIISMCRDGWSIREIADELDITSARASDEKYKAIRKLRQRLTLAG
ncbi:MAG: sigma-70 family RNA polymerase sigma factor [Planctomycetes bacterium]|nr:sigma-70 family RNA polymerase sigma factor [Planctomycetota bacterium]